MPVPSPSAESLNSLRQLRDTAFQKGENCLGALLAGLDLYISLGREWDLIEHMRAFAESMKDAVQNTPSAEELQRLYELREPDAER